MRNFIALFSLLRCILAFNYINYVNYFNYEIRNTTRIDAKYNNKMRLQNKLQILILLHKNKIILFCVKKWRHLQSNTRNYKITYKSITSCDIFMIF